MSYIYQITNKINNKIYIGKTELSINKRFYQHCMDSKKERCENRPLYSAMSKYGIENFCIELIEETSNPIEREIYWINKKDSYHNGYNTTLGGDGKNYLDYNLIIKTYEKEQNIQKTAEILNISKDSVRIILHSHNIIVKTSSEVNKQCYGKSIFMYDKQNNLLEKFDSIKEAGRYIIMHQYTKSSILEGVISSIRKCANKQRRSAYNFIWEWETT